MVLAVMAEPVLPGAARGRVMRLAGPFSFWGGADPQTGLISDPSSPQAGHSLSGRILMIPDTRGSSSSSAVLLELLYAQLAPAALILGEIDAIAGLGILVAQEMGWPSIPLALLPAQLQLQFDDTQTVELRRDGSIVVLPQMQET